MCAIAANALFTALGRRGTTRQLARTIVICVISALLLLPAVVWYDLRFTVKQAVLSTLEIDVLLGYVAMCGWVLPLGMTTSYLLLSKLRNSVTATGIPRQKRAVETEELHPPRYQPGVISPFVFGEEVPWGWLEYRKGNFQGQRLELKREVLTIGRDENCDIWLDDEMASRHHAELAWDVGRVCLTDCGSLNGVLLNSRRVHGTVLLSPNDILEIGSQRFTFILADRTESNTDQFDPLTKHIWRSTTDLQIDDAAQPISDVVPATQAPVAQEPEPPVVPRRASTQVPTLPGELGRQQWMGTEELDSPAFSSAKLSGTLVISDGVMAGASFLLDRPIVTLGRDAACEVSIDDASLSRHHVQFLCQSDGDYIQDMGSRNGTKVNGELVLSPRLLQPGDALRVGNITIEYVSIQTARTTPLPPTITPPPTSRLLSGPTPLKLPSRQKE